MGRVNMLHFPLAGQWSRQDTPALPLRDEEVNDSLARRIRQRLKETPVLFSEGVGILDFPLIHMEWVALCQTAGLVRLRGTGPEWEVYCLLLSGLEDEAEAETVRAHCPMFEPYWPAVEEAERPVAVAGYLSAAWLQNPAVATLLGAFANAYFTQFGQSDL